VLSVWCEIEAEGINEIGIGLIARLFHPSNIWTAAPAASTHSGSISGIADATPRSRRFVTLVIPYPIDLISDHHIRAVAGPTGNAVRLGL
jgi:hypothetical protein